jgi:hypothetical protein
MPPRPQQQEEPGAQLTKEQLAEVARRRRVLGIEGPAGNILSDKQVLEIADPGPGQSGPAAPGPGRSSSPAGRQRKEGSGMKSVWQEHRVGGQRIKAETKVSETAMSLVLAVTAGNVATVKEMLKSGGGSAHVNQRTEDGNSLLIHAIKYCPRGSVSEDLICGCLGPLIEHGAEVNYRNKQGQTPLHFAFAAQPMMGQVADLVVDEVGEADPARCAGSSADAGAACKITSDSRLRLGQRVGLARTRPSRRCLRLSLVTSAISPRFSRVSSGTWRRRRRPRVAIRPQSPSPSPSPRASLLETPTLLPTRPRSRPRRKNV